MENHICELRRVLAYTGVDIIMSPGSANDRIRGVKK